MLRIFLSLLILTSCSLGTVKTGGEERYSYDPEKTYQKDDLQELASKIVTTSQREPKTGKLNELFGPTQRPLKRVGIVIFETTIQPTRGGLAFWDKVYLNEKGKQILTENFLKIWEESIPLLAPELQYVPSAKIKRAKSLKKDGSMVEDYVLSKRSVIAPDDIFYLESGKKTTNVTVLNPRGMSDLSFMMVPASELMGGPKWSEHKKHLLNDFMKEMNLDAAIVVMSEVSWTAAHKDKYSDEFIPEEIKYKISASTLLSLSQYNERLEKLGYKEKGDVTLCYRAYETKMKIPVTYSVPEMDQNFATIEKEIIQPMFKTYSDLSQMTLIKLTEDLKKTW